MGQMTDAEYEAQLGRIRALTDAWIAPLGLKWWRVNMEYVRDSGEYKLDGKASPDGVANTHADYRYLHATITWNIPRVAEQDEERLEWIFVHECCHILIQETRGPEGDGFNDWLSHEERVCSTLASAFIWTRDSVKGECA